MSKDKTANVTINMPVPEDFTLPPNFEEDMNEWIKDHLFGVANASMMGENAPPDARVDLENALLATALKHDDFDFAEAFFKDFEKKYTVRSPNVRTFLEKEDN